MYEVEWVRVGTFVTSVACISLATGALKEAGRLPCDLARKSNHVFALAGGALWFGWLPAPLAENSAYAVGAILLVLVPLTCAFRNRVPFRFAFLANTRKSDAPHEAFYFWSSWLLSISALAVIHVVVDDVVVTRTAALLVGIGDGIAEPIGRRLGRHKYRVLSLTMGTPAIRSWEGSAAVFVGCFLTLIACFGVDVVGIAVVIALILTFVEAVSPHGLDNLTIPVAAALCLRAAGV